MQGVHEERHPVLDSVEDLWEEDHGGGVMGVALNMDASQAHVLIADFLGVALDGGHCRELEAGSAEELGCGPRYVLLHLKIINPRSIH